LIRVDRAQIPPARGGERFDFVKIAEPKLVTNGTALEGYLGEIAFHAQVFILHEKWIWLGETDA
jgi:hypothetical protein